MNRTGRHPITTPPCTYQDWLDHFQHVREAPLFSDGWYDILTQGSFSGSDTVLAALEQQIIRTVNTILDRSTKRFIRDLNECITFRELAHMDILFKRLKKNIHKATFFLELSFLSVTFKNRLYQSIKEHMTLFWNNTIRFLRQQSVEFPNGALEDALFLVGRIKLFS
jgi:hypothetical protein